jgi:penicillin V acylase-like amidase (Ntn superfamily)
MQYQRFLLRTDDPLQVKRDKIKVMMNLCDVDNHQALIREFMVCSRSQNATFLNQRLIQFSTSFLGLC